VIRHVQAGGAWSERYQVDEQRHTPPGLRVYGHGHDGGLVSPIREQRYARNRDRGGHDVIQAGPKEREPRQYALHHSHGRTPCTPGTICTAASRANCSRKSGARPITSVHMARIPIDHTIAPGITLAAWPSRMGVFQNACVQSLLME